MLAFIRSVLMAMSDRGISIRFQRARAVVFALISVSSADCLADSKAGVAVGDHCSLSIPSGYELVFSSGGEKSFSKGIRDPGMIVVKKYDYPGAGKSVDSAVFPLFSYRNYVNFGHRDLLYFRMSFADYSVGITGSDASRYQEILKNCLPENFVPFPGPEIVKREGRP